MNESILKEERNCWKLTSFVQGVFLIDGKSYFETLYECLCRARRSIFIVGWDLNSEVELLRDGEAAQDLPSRLGALLNALAQRQEELHIYILCWDYSAVYTFEREFFQSLKLNWQTHERMRFVFDDQHPVGAAHHQKVVVIDDSIAFCGGFDLTTNRWDTPAHQASDPRRTTPSGQTYRPFHDVQIGVYGETAYELGNLARDRWQRATGEQLASPSPPTFSKQGQEIWGVPSSNPEQSQQEPQERGSQTQEQGHKDRIVFRGGKIGIARTYPPFKYHPEIREVEQLYLDLIANTRHQLYIENQFLTSRSVVEALCQCLQAEEGPEVVLVLPRHLAEWKERQTIGLLQNEMIRRLRKADKHQRLGLYCPIDPRLEEYEQIVMHSKVMIADGRYARVGSSNAGNRCMGLDTECDLVLDAGDSPEAYEAIQEFLASLLADHLAISTQQVQSALTEHQSLRDTIQSLCREQEKSLRPMPPPPEVDGIDEVIADLDLMDLEQPMRLEQVADEILSRGEPGPGSPNVQRSRWGLIITLLLATAIAAAWIFTPLNQYLNQSALGKLFNQIEQSSLTWLWISLLYLLAGILFVPLNLLLIVTVLVFPLWQALLYVYLGSMCNVAVGYGLGRLFGKQVLRRYFPKSTEKIAQKVVAGGFFGVLLVRMIPVAPNTLLNLVLGASRLPFWIFMGATALGILPGTLSLLFFEKSLLNLFQEPSWSSVGIFVGVLVLLIAGFYLINRRFSKSPQVA